MEQVSKSQFKPRALEYFRTVEATGRPLIITDHGVPKLEIRPCPAPPSPLEPLRGSVIFFDTPPP